MYRGVFKDGILISEDFLLPILNLDCDAFGTYTFVLLTSCGSAYVATSNIILEG